MSGFPYVAPPEGGLERAFADARHRRFRTAGLSTSSLAAVLTVAVAVLGGQGTQSLVQHPAPEQPAVSQLLPDGEATPWTERRNGETVVSTVTTRDPGRTRADVPAPAVDARATATPSGSGLGGDPGRRAGDGTAYAAPDMTRTDNTSGQIGNTYATSTPGCELGGYDGAPTDSLCTDTWVGQGSSGGAALQAQVCSSRTRLTLLNYRGRNEVDLEVRRGDTVVWRWSTWHPDTDDAHKVGLDAQSCIVWSVAWTEVDGHGRALPKGDYELRATFLADELSTRVSSAPFTIR